MVQSMSPGLSVLILVTIFTGALTIYALVKTFAHGLQSTRKGQEVYARLRPGRSVWQLPGATLKEPQLPLTQEAAHLPETGEMMSSYWKSGGRDAVRGGKNHARPRPRHGARPSCLVLT